MGPDWRRSGLDLRQDFRALKRRRSILSPRGSLQRREGCGGGDRAHRGLEQCRQYGDIRRHAGERASSRGPYPHQPQSGLVAARLVTMCVPSDLLHAVDVLDFEPDHLAGAQAAAMTRLSSTLTLRLLATASRRRVSSWLSHRIARCRNSPSARQTRAHLFQRFGDLGQEIPARALQTTEGFGAFHKAEIDKWWPIIKAANIRME
jgi:hypothetical protein